MVDLYAMYLKINGTASSSNHDVEFMQFYPYTNQAQFVLERRMISGGMTNSNFGYLQLDLNKGDYLSLFSTQSNRAKVFGYSVFSR